MSDPDYIVDIDGLRDPGGPGVAGGRQRRAPQEPARDQAQSGDGSSFRGRPWLAVRWGCCHVYSRIYRSRDGTVYHGACPRCGRSVTARVGPNGTTSRFFEAI